MFKIRIKKSKQRLKNQNDFIWYIIVFMFEFIMLVPEIFSHISGYNYIRIMQNFISIVSIVLFITLVRNSFLRLTFLLFICFLISTIINDSNYASVLYYFSRSFGLIVPIMYIYPKNKEAFWRATSDYFALNIYINTIFTVLSPEGILTSSTINKIEKGFHFLGEKNQVMPFLLIGVTIAMIYKHFMQEKQYRVYCLLICTWICGIYYLSATSTIGLIVFTILLLWKNVKVRLKRKKTSKKSRKWTFIFGVFAIICCYYLLVVQRIQNYFGSLIAELFNKDVTLSTRTFIWDAALKMVQESPIWGYGGTETKYIQLGSMVYNAHNILLQMLLMGGIVMLVVFVLLVSRGCIDLSKVQTGDVRKAITALLIALFVMSLAEVYAISLLIFSLMLPKLVLGMEKNEEFRFT